MKRTVSLAGDWAFISSRDPAIDTSAEGCDYAKYFDTRDESHLRFIDGKEPARFTIRALTRVEREELEGYSLGTTFRVAAQMALRQITGFVVDVAGAATEVHAQHDARGRLTIETVDALGYLLTAEVGQAALSSARATEKFS
jgi:hypothetical protein